MAVLMGVLVLTGLYDVTLVGAAPAWTELGLALQAAVTEELWMRAAVPALMADDRTRAGLRLTAVVFGALHLTNPAATAMTGATATVAGLMFCALYAVTGRLWVPIGLHPRLELRPGLPLRSSSLRHRPRRLDRRQHRQPWSAAVADRRNLRPRSLAVRATPGQLGDSSRHTAGSEDRPLRRPTAPVTSTPCTPTSRSIPGTGAPHNPRNKIRTPPSREAPHVH
jgi:hypothetical protein